MMRTSTPLSLLPTFLLSLNKASNYLTGKIACDERVLFFPTLANKINATHWHVPIHGWIFEPETESKKRRVAIKGLGKLFQVNDVDEKRLLKRRLMWFTVDNQSMKHVKIAIVGSGIEEKEEGEGDHYRLPRSAKDGHFIGHLTLRNDELLDAADSDGIVRYEAIDHKRTFAGAIHLLPPTGVSIISDIDDTVKITNYLDKKEFYKNTFLREFKQVPGMKELFHACKSKYDNNCSIHYVSASPYQLFEELSNFFTTAGFPSATYHLKRIRVKDKTLLQLFADPEDYKIRQITPILNTYPLRKFILIGDSGEKDPEVYKELIRRYPNQIEKIWIRNVNGANATRMEGVDPGRWRFFSDGYDLMDEVV